MVDVIPAGSVIPLCLPQSSEALEFMKRDLTEFTQVVQHDTACTIAATASVVKEKLAVSTTCVLRVTVPHT